MSHHRDRGVALALLLLLALVFAPAIGLHVAVSTFGPGASPGQGVAAMPD